MRRGTLTLALISVLVLAVPRAEASYARDAGLGVGCVFVNLLYMPAKFLYATLGGITGGFAYLLTGANFEVADKIWAPSLGGNYVVTPAHLRNEQTLYFSGSVEDEQP
ncbi:MAG: hypothetical protein ACREQQ_00490 [Candidatus Binatia bacterium]